MHSEVIMVAIYENPLDNPAKGVTNFARTVKRNGAKACVGRVLGAETCPSSAHRLLVVTRERGLAELVVRIRPQDVRGAVLASPPSALHGAAQVGQAFDARAEVVGDVARLLAVV